MKNQFIGLHVDFLGFGASMLCAIHCAALPILISVLPLTAFHFLDNHLIEYMLISLSLAIASYALVHGYQRYHRKYQVLVVMLLGFGFIVASRLVPDGGMEVLLSVCGGVTIAIAHWINWKYIHRSKHDLPACIHKSEESED